MKKALPVLLAVMVMAAFVVAGVVFFPKPPELPVFTSKPPVPLSIAPSGTPKPNPIPSLKDAIADLNEFTLLVKPLEDTNATPLYVNLNTGQILFSGVVSCNYGRLEFLLSSLGGKAYESLIMAHYNAGEINVACLAVGAMLPEGYDSRRFRGAEQLQPIWPRFIIEMLYTGKDGKIVRDRVENFVLSTRSEATMPLQEWAYTGSYILMDEETQQELWMADISKNIGAIFYDPTCIFQNTDSEWHNDDAYVAAFETCPPIDTGVLVLMTIVRPVKK